MASVRISSHYSEFRAGAYILVRNTGWNQNDITEADLDCLAVLSAKSQFCKAIIDTEHLVRRAVIMSEGIDAIPPRIAPIVLSESALED
jgi:hypothetical protein